MTRKKPSLTFLLPSRGTKPTGGFKVAFEYANYLAENGYEVHLAYPSSMNFKHQSLKQKIRSILRYPYAFFKGYTAQSWFKLNKNIKEHWIMSLNERHVPKTDFYVATALQTSFYLKGYHIPDNNKLYLIQDFENWNVSSDVVYDSYRLGLKNIVISNWLKDRVKKANAECTLIRNGFDFNYFRLQKSIDDRSLYAISMLYHDSLRKGCEYGLEALSKIKTLYPQLKAYLFGTLERPKNLPDWIEYYQNPNKQTHNDIYNSSSIYLAPSLQEGWGLTVGEAMICGNAIVCTDTLGFKEMVTDGKEGLIVPAKNSDALANALCKLIENPELRKKMARSAVKTISNFSWDNSFKLFESLLTEEN